MIAKTNQAPLWYTLTLAMLALISAAFLLRLILTSGTLFSYDYDEGWNAFQAMAAMSGGDLYPAPSSFMYNNYPPLSYYAIGPFGLMLGDNIIAGRIVSILSLCAIMAGLVLTAMRMGCSRREGLFGALFFSTLLLVDYHYAGMNDPQLLGHAFSIAGIWFLFREPRRMRDIAICAFLLSLGFFTKQSLVVVPIAAVLWLASTDRSAALRLASIGAGFCVAGFGAFQLIFDSDLWSHINSPRIYSHTDALENLIGWLSVTLAPTLATLYLSRRFRHDAPALFCAIYLTVGTVAGLLFSGGAGTSGNVFFDAAIALGLGAAVGLNRLGPAPNASQKFFAACFAAPLALILIYLAASDGIHPRLTPRSQKPEMIATKDDIAFLRASDGPAVCATLALCYWAGKKAEVDVGMIGQAFLTGRRKPESLAAAIRARRFAVLQLSDTPERLFPASVARAIRTHYAIHHEDIWGYFYVRR